jgi:predicted nucleic acid-binding protein
MTDAVFDTTVFSDSYYRYRDALALLTAATDGRMEAAYSPITAYELWVRSMDRAEQIFHAATLASLQEIPFNSTLARQVADWLRGATRTQRLSLAADAVIAATAHSLGATLYTRNPRDFGRWYANVRPY